MYLAFQDNKMVDQHDVKKNEYQNVERKLLKWVLGITYLLVGLLCGLALASMVPMEDVRIMIFVHYCVSASFLMTLLKFMIPLNYKFFKTLYQIQRHEFYTHAPREIPLAVLTTGCVIAIFILDFLVLFYFSCHMLDEDEHA